MAFVHVAHDNEWRRWSLLRASISLMGAGISRPWPSNSGAARATAVPPIFKVLCRLFASTPPQACRPCVFTLVGAPFVFVLSAESSSCCTLTACFLRGNGGTC